MKKEAVLNEEDFLQQFPHQSLFEQSVEEIPEWFELGQDTAQAGKPFNFFDLHSGVSKPAAVMPSSNTVSEEMPIEQKGLT